MTEARAIFISLARRTLVTVLFVATGALVFYVTLLTTGDSWKPVWEKHGVSGVIWWAYEHASILTITVLVGLAFACAWMPFDRSLAAISLALFYPIYAMVQIVMGTHTGNLLPLEFIGYLFVLAICLLGHAAGRWAFGRIGQRVSS
jgi:hypothetical protein